MKGEGTGEGLGSIYLSVYLYLSRLSRFREI